MADARASFSVDLEDNTSGAAEAAASSLENLAAEIAGGQRELGQMQAAMRRLKGSTDEVAAAKAQLATQIDATRAKVSSAQASFTSLGGDLNMVADAAKGAGAGAEAGGVGVKDLGGLAEAAGGRLGQMAGQVKKLAAVAGPALLVAALVVAAVAIGALIYKVAEFGFLSANAARSSNLLVEAAGDSAVEHERLSRSIEEVSAKTSMARAAVQKSALAMEEAGLSSNQLDDALAAVGTTAAAMGDEAAGKLQGIAEEAGKAGKLVLDQAKLIGTGLAIDDVASVLADSLGVSLETAKKRLEAGKVDLDQGMAAIEAAVEKKFGKIAKAKLLDFDVQIAKAKENIADIFADVDIEPLLEGLREVLSIFDESTASGQALRTLARTVLNPMFEAASALAPIAKKLFQGMVIGALLVAIGVLKVKNAYEEAFGGSATEGVDLATAALYAGAGAVMLFVAGVALLGAAVAAVVAPFFMMYEAVSSAIELLGSIDLASLGSAMIAGLVDGLLGGLGGVVSAMLSLGDAAIGALKSKLQIFSPSRIMRSFGRFTSGGLAGGIEDGESDVEDAATSVAAIPAEAARNAIGGMAKAGGAGAAGAQGGAPAGAAGGNTYVFHVGDEKTADKMREPSFLRKLSQAVELKQAIAARA